MTTRTPMFTLPLDDQELEDAVYAAAQEILQARDAATPRCMHGVALDTGRCLFCYVAAQDAA